MNAKLFSAWIATASFCVVASLAACATPLDVPRDSVDTVQGALLGSQPNTTHPAVVSLGGSNGATVCTGTIIKVDAASKVGFVLTAAHCADKKPNTVYLGDEPSALSTRRFFVLDAVSAPYTGTPGETSRDVAVLRILGVDASTPVLPVADAADGVAVGSSLTIVGYGVNALVSPEPARRRSMSLTVSDLGAPFLRYSLASGGPCVGDDGAPLLIGTGAAARVVGVHVLSDAECKVSGSALRVSSELAFIQSATMQAAPAASCRICAGTAESGDNLCAKRRDACFGDPACTKLIECRSACRNQACADACVNASPEGAPLFLGFFACSCHDACATECGSTTGCNAVPKCGVAAAAGDACATCGAEKCCKERAAATYDKTGYACLQNANGAGCGNNAPFQAYTACLAKSCATECPVPEGPTTTRPPEKPSPAAPSSEASSSGCAQSPSTGTPFAWCVAALLLLGLRGRSRKASR